MDWNCDSEHRSTYYLLTNAPALARKFDENVHVDDDGIDWTSIEAKCYSSSEQLLVAVARDLWNGTGQAHVGGLMTTLDETNFDVVLEAMRIRRTWTTS